MLVCVDSEGEVGLAIPYGHLASPPNPATAYALNVGGNTQDRQTKMTVDEAIDKQETLDFLKVAAEYCLFVENEDSKGIEFCSKARQVLARLYLTAIHLPEVSVTTNNEFDNNVTDEQQQSIITKLADNFGGKRFYWDTFDPMDESDKDSVCYDLVDDLADIYIDIKSCFMTYHQGTIEAKEHGLWELKFTFNTHWGRHSISALRALHSIMTNG